MNFRKAVSVAIFGCIVFVNHLNAQPGDRHLLMKSRVLDVLFPINVEPQPYSLKMIMRYGDSNTQIIVVVYPGGKSELIQYSLDGMNDADFEYLIAIMYEKNQDITVQEIAARVKVKMTRTLINYKALKPLIKTLEDVRISPALDDVICLDACDEYEFWYDNWQDAVHYTFLSPAQGSQSKHLVDWMIHFRAYIPDLINSGSQLNGSIAK